ncbi:MAG: glycosyltransferase [Candidatus Microsaccharimonas sp.]
MADLKKVSIVIPVYNGSNFLREAIDSALAQTYKNTEVVVVNDGSNDDGATASIARSYGKQIKYYEKPNGGVATALNYGIEKMTGEYFSWLSHDDMYEKKKIEEQMKFLSGYDSEKTIVACEAKVLFDSGVTKKDKIDAKLFSYFDIFLAIAGDIGVNGCSLLIPKAAFEKVGGFDTNLPVTQDYDLWFRLNKHYNFVLLDKSLVISRRHEGQDSVTKQNLMLEAGDRLHYDFLRAIDMDRFHDFMSNGGEEKVWQEFTIYKNANFVRTSSMILRNILAYYRKHSDERHKELLLSEIGRIDPPKSPRDDRKKILFYSNVWRMGGVERVISYLFEALKQDYDIFLAINDDGIEINEGFPIPKNVQVIKLNNHSLMHEIMNVTALFNIDIFVGNPNFDKDFLDIYPSLEGTHTKSIAYNHTHFMLPYMMERLLPVALKQPVSFDTANAVVWISQVACNVYNLDHDNGVLIPNPVRVDQGVVKPRKAPGKRILAVGRFGEDELKRIDRIIKVFSEIIKVDPDYSLDIVGYCNLDIPLIHENYIRLGDYIKKLGIPEDRIVIHGDQKNVKKFYDKADILLMTSDLEGFALVLVEAMARGIPCACFDYVGLEEIVRDGKNGVVAEQDDHAGLARKIVDIVQNKSDYAVYSKNALDTAHMYREEVFIEKWKTLLKNLVNDAVIDSSLLPGGTISEKDKKLVTEYRHLLDTTVRRYIDVSDKLAMYQEPPTVQHGNRLSVAIDRLDNSLRSHGGVYTLKVLVKKSYRKLRSKIN